MKVINSYDYKFKKFKRVRLGDVYALIVKNMVDAGWVDKTPAYSGEYPAYFELFSSGKNGTDSLYFKMYLSDGPPTSTNGGVSASKASKDIRSRCSYTIRQGVNDAESMHWYMPLTTSSDYYYSESAGSGYYSDLISSDYYCDVYIYADKECIMYAVKHGFYYSSGFNEVFWGIQVPQHMYVQPLVDDMYHKITQFSSCAGKGVDTALMYHLPKNAPTPNNPVTTRVLTTIDYLKDQVTPAIDLDFRMLTATVGDSKLGLISKLDGVFLIKPNSVYIRSGNTLTVKLDDGTTRKAVFLSAAPAYRTYGISVGGVCLMLEDA